MFGAASRGGRLEGSTMIGGRTVGFNVEGR